MHAHSISRIPLATRHRKLTSNKFKYNHPCDLPSLEVQRQEAVGCSVQRFTASLKAEGLALSLLSSWGQGGCSGSECPCLPFQCQEAEPVLNELSLASRWSTVIGFHKPGFPQDPGFISTFTFPLKPLLSHSWQGYWMSPHLVIQRTLTEHPRGTRYGDTVVVSKPDTGLPSFCPYFCYRT